MEDSDSDDYDPELLNHWKAREIHFQEGRRHEAKKWAPIVEKLQRHLQ